MTEVSQPSWEEIFAASNTRALARVHKAEPAQVVSFNRTLGTCVAQVMVSDEPEPLPPLQDVPVVFPGGGGYVITFPLDPGDRVLVVYVDLDPSAYQNNGGLSGPNILRRHGRYPYAFPMGRGHAGEAGDPTEAGKLVISAGPTRFVLDTSSAYVGGSVGAVPLALAPQVEARLTLLEQLMATHIHPTPSGPSSIMGPVPPPPTVGTPVAASVAKGL